MSQLSDIINQINNLTGYNVPTGSSYIISQSATPIGTGSVNEIVDYINGLTGYNIPYTDVQFVSGSNVSGPVIIYTPYAEGGTIPTNGILPGQIIKAEHVLRIINALNGVNIDDIIISGSLQTSGSNIFNGTVSMPFIQDGKYLYTSGGFLIGVDPGIESASYALTASYAPDYVLNSTTSSMLAPYLLISQTSSIVVLSSSYALTSSYAQTTLTASYALTSSYALIARTASYALTSSYALTARTSSYALTALTASQARTASVAISSSYALTASYARTASFAISSSYALVSSQALTASYARTASFAISSSYALTASYVRTASFAISSSYALIASQARTASFALQARTASFAVSSSYAATASNILGGKATHIPFFKTDTTLTTSSIYQSGSSTVIINQDSATSENPEALYVWQPNATSINVISGKGNLNSYLQLNIQNTNQGTNASSDVVATAGNGNEDSNYIDMGINSDNFSGFLGGPNDAYLYATGSHLHIGNATPDKPIQFFVGGPDTNTNRKLELNADGYHNITGSLEIDTDLVVLGGITGSLYGTASYVTGSIFTDNNSAASASYALTASYALNTQNVDTGSLVTTSSFNSWTGSIASQFAGTASYAETASYILQAVSSSYVKTAQTASYVALSGYGIEVNEMQLTASVRTVNGIFPTNGNISVSITQTITGTSASLILSSSGAITGSFPDGLAWIITSGPGTGSSYIYSSASVGAWYPVANENQAVNDARYLMLDTSNGPLTGDLNMGTKDITNAGTVTATSFAGTASWATNAIQATSASYVTSSNVAGTVLSASYAITASYAANAGNVNTGSLVSTSSFNSYTGSVASQFAGTASYAFTASVAPDYVLTSATSSMTVGTATNATNAQSGSNFVITSTLVVDETLIDFAKKELINAPGTWNLFNQATGSWTSAHCKYTVYKGANSRAGEFVTSWNGTTVSYYDSATVDIGDTSDITFQSLIVTSQIQINAVAASTGWTVKMLVTYL